MFEKKELEKLYSVRQFAELLNVDPQVVYRMVRRGAIEHMRIGRGIRFRAKVVEDAMAKTAIPDARCAEDQP